MGFSSFISPSPVSTLPGGKAYGQPDDEEDGQLSQDDGTQVPTAPTSAAAYFTATSPFKTQGASTQPADSSGTGSQDPSNLSAAAYFSAQKPSFLVPPAVTPPRPIPSAPVPSAPTVPRPNYTVFGSDPVLSQALAPEIKQERQAQAQDANNAAAQQREANARMQTTAQTTGLRTTRDGDGNVVPLTDPDSGKPLYKPHTGDVQYDPTTGKPFQQTRDQFGQITTANPDANAPVGPNTDDPTDPQLYRQNKYQGWEPIGHVDDLAGDDTQPADVRATAAKWQLQRGAAIRQSAVQAAKGQAANLQAQHIGVQNHLSSIGQQIDALSPTYDSETGAPLNDVARDAATASQTAGGVFGLGTSPTDEATAAAARNADRAQKLATLQQQQQQLAAQVGTSQQPGPLPLAVKAAQADAEITEHTLQSANYQDMANARRALLKTEGKSADNDPVLANIVKTQADFGVKANAAQQAHDGVAQQAAATGQDIDSLYTRTSLNGDPAAPGQSPAPAPVQAFSPSVPGQPTSVQPFRSNDPPYRVDDQGNLTFNPARMVAGIAAARDAGLIDPAKAAQMIPQARTAQDAAQAQQATVNELNAKEASAGSYAQGKALLTGASKAAGFLAASAPGVAAGETVGVALAPFTFGISAVAGPVIGGLITGTLGSMAVDKTERVLAKHSDTIKSFTDASDLHPYYDTAGNLLAFGAGLPKVATAALSTGAGAIADAVGDNVVGRAAQATANQYARGTGSLVDTVQNLSSQASVQAAGGATTGQIAGKIAGQVGKVVGANVAIDTAIKEGGQMLGLSDDHQTWGGALQAAAVGAFLSGHGIEVGSHDPQQVGDILARGNATVDAGNPLTSTLTKSEIEIFQKAKGALDAYAAKTGADPSQLTASARQANQHGQPYGVVSADVIDGSSQPGSLAPADAANGPQRNVPGSSSRAPLSPSAAPVAPGSSALPAEFPSGAPTTGRTSSPASSEGTPSGAEEGGQPSAGSTAPVPAGQAPAVLAGMPPEQVAASFASRNPGAPALHPAVVAKSFEYVPPGLESIPEPQERADARLAATQQIQALPDAPPTTDGHGQPTANPDPTRARDTASALLKLASGFEVDHLTAAEQARLKPKGEPPLARKSPDGDTILTDAGRQQLTQAAPAAAAFIDGTEAEELRARAQPTPPVPPPETTSTPPPARAEPPPVSRSHIPGLDPAPTADIPQGAPRQEVRTAPTPKPPEPTSPRGIEAKRRIDFLEQKQHEAQSIGADITDGQKAALAGARGVFAEELAKQPAPPPSTTRQPVSPAGKRSQEILAHFDAVRERGDTLNEHQERARDEAQRTLDLDLNRQVLGPAAKPTTPSGQRALRDYIALTGARDAGAHMSRGDHEAIQRHFRTIQDDHTAQRRAIEAREAGQPTAAAQKPVVPGIPGNDDVLTGTTRHLYTQRGRNAQKIITDLEAQHKDLRARGSDLKPGQKEALGNVRSALAAELAKPPPDDLAVGDVIKGDRRYTVSDLGDETHVGITAPEGKQLKMLRADALKGRIERAGEPGTPPPAASIPGLEHLSNPAPRIEVPAGQGDKPSVIKARAWIADQRQAGRDFMELPEALGKQFGIGLDRARTLVAEQAAAEQNAKAKAPVPAKPAPRFTENQRVLVGGRAGTVEKISGDRATVRLRPTPTMASEVREVPVSKLRQPPARRFQLPDAPMGQPDLIDHIHEQGGMMGKTEAERIARGKGLPGGVGASYDDVPGLKGIYQQKVFGGKMAPDQMAAFLHDERGVGDGSVGGMYRAIDEAMQSRRSGKVEQAKQAVVEQQAGRFDKDALTPGTAKGKTEINTSNLSVGDKVQVGDQTLTVRDIDPDSLDVELEDHSKYGVQKVADGQSLYVEKVEPRSDSVGAADPSAPEDRQPITPRAALNTAKGQVRENWPLLARLGIKRFEFAATKAGSGVEFGDDQVLRIHPGKLAASMETVRDLQGRKGIDSTPERWFAQVLAHEGIHGAQAAVARAKGMSLKQYFDSLPDAAMPKGWQEAGRKAYGSEWDGLENWQQKAELSRMILEKGHFGQISEALYRHLKNTVEFLRRVAGFEGTDPVFRQHIEEVAQRLEEARKGSDAEPGWKAFPPESGTLGIPRDQMPQIANEHRGPLVQFFKGQGMTVHAAPVDPRTLKPSQAEYSPAKVEQARNFEGTKRPILYSSDGHVIDGHHQWVQSLEDAPDKPIPGVRINAPARDILSRIHEFPSAGMDGPPRLRSGERQGDLLSHQTEDLRLVGEQGTDHGARQAAQEQAARDTADAKARQDRDQGTLFAAKPSAADGDESDGGVLGRIREKINGIGQAIADAREQSQQHGDIKARFDSIDNLARMAGQQAGGDVRLDFDNDLDRQAAGAVVEAGGQRAKLAADLASVKDSPNKKLAAKYTPIYQHALDNLPRLQAQAEGYRQIDAREDAAAERAGLTPQWQARTKHIYDDPLSPESTVVADKGFGATKGYKTAADAIAAGVDPVSTDLADLAERRVGRNQSAINQHAFEDSLAGMKATDGKPALASIEDSTTRLNPDGSATPTAKVPAGYEAVQAGNNVLVAHKEFAPVLKALYGQSEVRQHWLGSKLLDAAALAKEGTVGIFDTYHLMRTAMRALTGFQTSGYGRGLAVHEFSDKDLPRAVKAGEITQKEADYAKVNRAAVERGLRAGLNTGKVADNLLEAARQHNLIAHLPLVGTHLVNLNEFVFHQFQRGSMTQAYVVAETRNRARFPDLDDHEIARRSAKEVNEFYGNLGSQGFLASKTMQDLAKLVLFAPGFTEGSLRTEGRAIGQIGKIPVDLARGKGLRAGVVAQAMGGMVLSGIVASQALNLFTRGIPTWKNEEDGHGWDAWIPGGPHGRGFFFSPLSIAAEYSHALTKYMGGGESALDAAAHIASNKLSGPARAVKDLAGGTDYRGQPFSSTGARVRAAVGDALPLPMPAGPFITKDPKSATGYGLNHQKGALEKQLLAMAGLKVDAAPTARAQMYRIADAYRPKVNGQPGAAGAGAAHPSSYTDLRHALSNEDDAAAKDAIRRLVADGKPLEKIMQAVGLRSDGTVSPEYFTGSAETERKMLLALSPDQRKLWGQAQGERKADAEKLRQLTRQMLPELAQQQHKNTSHPTLASAR